MGETAYRGVIFDFGGVLTTKIEDSAVEFEKREGLAPGTSGRALTSPAGRRLMELVEAGQISQREWSRGFSELLDLPPSDDLMGRMLAALRPAEQGLALARGLRARGFRTAILSNSFPLDPHDPYAPYELHADFDAVVLSADHLMRKPDPAIYELTLDLLGVPPRECVFVDDTAKNLDPARDLGMQVVHATDEQVTASALKSLLG